MYFRLAGRLLTPVPKSTSQGVKLLKPLIEERLKQYELHGKDWPDKPVNCTVKFLIFALITQQNDMLSWLIDAAPEDEKALVPLTRRILTLNFAAIHTSSIVSSSYHEIIIENAHPLLYYRPLPMHSSIWRLTRSTCNPFARKRKVSYKQRAGLGCL